jgi:hypothetical protein
MKKKLLIISSAFALLIMTTSCVESSHKSDIEKLREKHQTFLDNSPYKETQHLSKKDRKALAAPPNAYYEQLWDLTMDPNTGRPMPEKLDAIQAELISQRNVFRGVGGDNANPWVNRGPNNQGGRTRGIMFDPNDIGNANPIDDYTRVFAGGVSGGLWVNEDITNASSPWALVTGMQANISVTTIISDPNNSNTFYIGSGESFTSGDAVGRGVWKSVDAGVSWQNIFGGYTSFDSSNGIVNGIFYINDIVARDVAGFTELYIGVGSAFYGSASSPNNFNGVNDAGVYKSEDGGANWTRFNIQHSNGLFKNPSDLEIDINNNIWFTTTRSVSGNAGGDIYRSTDGLSFTLVNTIPNASRTELEVSSTDANRFWIAASVNGSANLYTSDDAFATFSDLNEPNDADNGIPANDYTRGQAFYDLPIEVDENNNLYVGGIDLFVSQTNGAAWTQISKWSNNPGLNTLNVPLVHADQHAIVFRPGSNGSQAAIGNDGGVYFAGNLAVTSGNSGIQSRNNEYNTTQFYYGTIDGAGGANGDDLSGGTQDNGTQILLNGTVGTNSFFDPAGGDGGFTEIDDIGTPYIITTYPGNNHLYFNYPVFNVAYQISSGTGGSFINEATLDKNLNILYTNASSGVTRVIERISNFTNGEASVQTNNLTNTLMNSSPSALKVSPYTTSTTTLLAGLRNGRLLKVNFANFAPIFTNISGPSFVGSISDIEFGQSEQEIFVTMHNYGVVSIWYTSNGGTEWRSIEGNLPDMPVKCILQNPLIPNELIVGTDLGVWATPDFTVTNPVWIPAFNGMSDAKVLDLDLRVSDNLILASTHGRGLFTSSFTSMPLSVLENEATINQITVFPTVSNGQISITSKTNIGKTNLEVYNVSGQKVFNTSMDLSGITIDLSLKLSSGMYFVKFNGRNYTETKRIVIK